MEAQIVHQTGVMHRFLAKARDEGWDVVGAAADARAKTSPISSSPRDASRHGQRRFRSAHQRSSRVQPTRCHSRRHQQGTGRGFSQRFVAAGILIHRFAPRADA